MQTDRSAFVELQAMMVVKLTPMIVEPLQDEYSTVVEIDYAFALTLEWHVTRKTLILDL